MNTGLRSFKYLSIKTINLTKLKQIKIDLDFLELEIDQYYSELQLRYKNLEQVQNIDYYDIVYREVCKLREKYLCQMANRNMIAGQIKYVLKK